MTMCGVQLQAAQGAVPGVRSPSSDGLGGPCAYFHLPLLWHRFGCPPSWRMMTGIVHGRLVGHSSMRSINAR